MLVRGVASMRVEVTTAELSMLVEGVASIWVELATE